MSLKVNEIFYSVQGEGPLLGVPSLFIRMQGCNLRCTWCDSKYTWPGVYKGYTQDALVKEIRLLSDAKHMVFTGGEPLLQEDELYNVVMDRFPDKHITFETNGTIDPHGDLFDRVDLWIVSPKKESTFEFDYGSFYREKVVFKFVVDDISDLEWIQDFIKNDEVSPEQVWLMPQAVHVCTMLVKLKWIAKYALEKGYNVTPRLQILIWGNKRGV